MRQILIGAMTLILGFFTLVFATVLGLFVSLCALIAKPFVMKKIRRMQEEQAGIYQQEHSQAEQTPFGKKHDHQGQTIDGDYQDITDRR
ncbi:hypothetical protein LRP49_02505 [Enterovibrio sp. ZSDZ35]|uniref:Uncharacterized protein n=1 Tax=Enterovibrio qingdaonensis TaxID=2899818 RepID=A0ABT5QHV3_9GAMM|nr:hypothetical protein [Enterovibrio sp. ZSDZ35]MDD1780060.1 hypothetical protein [Enterovibrio sp. ZSDZ35]